MTRFPCNVVVRAFVADHAFLLVCGDERLVALALPGERAPIASAGPLVVHAQPWQPFNVTMHAFAIPGNVRKTLRGAAFAADGTLWFCEHEEAANDVHAPSDFIGHLRSNGTIEEFPVPTVGAHVDAITLGRDGAMWFTEAAAVKVGRISPNGKIVEYPLPTELAKSPTTFSDPQLRKLGGLTVGPDGMLWITAPYAHALVRMTTSGIVRTIRLSDLTYPGAITRGPDGALWFDAGHAIGRVTVHGDTMLFPIPEQPALTSVIWGPDGNVWFSAADGRIGRITPKGAMRIFPARATAAPSGPLIGGCDGALYIADYARPKLWRMTVTGEFTPRDIAYRIGNLARAPDCTLGFTESRGRHLGTISLKPYGTLSQ
jgi:virginiamycin B lyase